jgi:hypothetical protein
MIREEDKLGFVGQRELGQHAVVAFAAAAENVQIIRLGAADPAWVKDECDPIAGLDARHVVGASYLFRRRNAPVQSRSLRSIGPIVRRNREACQRFHCSILSVECSILSVENRAGALSPRRLP